MVRMVVLGAVVGLLLCGSGSFSTQAQTVSADNGKATVPDRDMSAADPQVPVTGTLGDNGKVLVPTPDPSAPVMASKAKEVPTDNGHSSVPESNGARVDCKGCSPVSKPLMNRAQVTLKYLQEKGQLPSSLNRLTGAQIDALLRGKSWSSATLTGEEDKHIQRLLAFDADGRSRWLNFQGGARTYSTLCHYQIDEDMLCQACPVGPAQCSMIYQDQKVSDFIIAYDPEREQLEVYDWILPSRWENDRFLAPR